jgi:branched-chain amino acid transport system substrate-binding protein
MRKRIFALLALFAALSLVAAACGNDDGGGGETGATGATAATGGTVEKIDVTVYGQGAWTGPYNYLVVASFQAAQLAFDELNADPSYPANITFEQADTQGSGDNAPPVVQEVVSNPNTVAVVGPGFSGESRPGRHHEESAILSVRRSATNPASPAMTYWYRGVANDNDQGEPTHGTRRRSSV